MLYIRVLCHSLPPALSLSHISLTTMPFLLLLPPSLGLRPLQRPQLPDSGNQALFTPNPSLLFGVWVLGSVRLHPLWHALLLREMR